MTYLTVVNDARLAMIIDLMGRVFVPPSDRVELQIRVTGSYAKLRTIKEQYPFFNGPYPQSKRTRVHYLVVSRADVVLDVLRRVKDYIIYQKESIESSIQLADFKVKHLHDSSYEYPTYAALQLIAKFRGVRN